MDPGSAGQGRGGYGTVWYGMCVLHVWYYSPVRYVWWLELHDLICHCGCGYLYEKLMDAYTRYM